VLHAAGCADLAPLAGLQRLRELHLKDVREPAMRMSVLTHVTRLSANSIAHGGSLPAGLRALELRQLHSSAMMAAQVARLKVCCVRVCACLCVCMLRCARVARVAVCCRSADGAAITVSHRVCRP
jgi:hypothetical protein